MIFIFIVLILIIYLYNHKRKKEMSRYIIFLEDEYYNLINMLISGNNKERQEILKKATKTSLYKKIEDYNSDSITKFVTQHDDNEFTYNKDNDRPFGF